MYARSTTIQARPSEIDAGIRYVTDEAMPAVMAMQGCIGLSLLVDRESGRCIATSAWADEQAMRASDAGLQSVRERAGEIFGGGPEVAEWEIAILHRDHRSSEGTCVRCTWLQGDAARLDDAVELFRTQVLPTAEELTGFCSASLLIDRNTGRAVSAVSWDTREAMERSRERANQLRKSIAEQSGSSIIEVAEFELALAHLRVPELV